MTNTSKNLDFEIRLDWLELKRGIVTAEDVQDTLRVATPKAFGGTGSEWSPEHLLLAAVSSCFMTTYLALAEKFGFEITHYNARTTGRVELAGGKYQFTQIDVYPEIFIEQETARQKADTAVEKAGKYCLVSSSLSCPVTYHPSILIDQHPLHRSTVPAN